MTTELNLSFASPDKVIVHFDNRLITISSAHPDYQMENFGLRLAEQA